MLDNTDFGLVVKKMGEFHWFVHEGLSFAKGSLVFLVLEEFFDEFSVEDALLTLSVEFN